LLSLIALVHASPHLSLRELGLSPQRWRQNLAAGFVAAALLTPLVFSLNLAVLLWFRSMTGDSGDEHPFTRLARGGFGRDEWALLFFAAVVAAPIFEEVVFRGVLQPWSCHSYGAAWFLMTLALVFAIGARETQLREAWGGPLSSVLLAAAPALFVLALAPNLAMLHALGRTPVAAGILATSVLFAAAHSRVWPTPVALTVLALGIGVVAERTRNLLGPIVIHAVFNLVNCLLLAWGVAG
jgi:membrane protease YdiL (CAAX protease family)